MARWPFRRGSRKAAGRDETAAVTLAVRDEALLLVGQLRAVTEQLGRVLTTEAPTGQTDQDDDRSKETDGGPRPT